MLKTRIIPTLLWKNIGLVKGIAFDSWRRVGTIMPAVKVYNARQVDELIVVDITATLEDRLPDFAEVEEFSAECFVPLTVGGGIRSIEDIKQLLRAGADKVSINSAAYLRPEIINEAAERFGSQCVVASIDARRNPDGTYVCVSHSGTRDTGRLPGEWAAELELRGAGEILITSVELDGTMEGYDLELIRSITERVRIPVIASGGAGNYEHMYAALEVGRAAAVAAASIFHFTEQTPLEAKNYLAARGIPVRSAKVLV
ncbi:imidazole glycerol phosphate synthase subunit HisF [Geobacter sp. OR-1]|uniref:imidazole glycerol phosphate synthase subunit HisF n=1 Tax=Geobacter sp. OR-1 TaxID=1266765 RepID=UPI0005436911|nr:imidazole glycerol phosphate synthase cyclase subunit [Geobacter sp. OR-1]GAM09648.1 imidazole glycerol phosphate synthase subunit HisF [Geobacter sp. OR-1]